MKLFHCDVSEKVLFCLNQEQNYVCMSLFFFFWNCFALLSLLLQEQCTSNNVSVTVPVSASWLRTLLPRVASC